MKVLSKAKTLIDEFRSAKIVELVRTGNDMDVEKDLIKAYLDTVMRRQHSVTLKSRKLSDGEDLMHISMLMAELEAAVGEDTNIARGSLT